MYIQAILLITMLTNYPMAEPALPQQELNSIAETETEIPALLQTLKISNVSIVEIKGGKVVFNRSFGIQGNGGAVTSNSLYNVASLTKPITAEVVLKMSQLKKNVSDGKCKLTGFSLNERLSNYWQDPDIANDPKSDKLTALLALSHQTGLPNWRYVTEGKLQFIAEPGEKFTYSGEGYMYLSKFLEKRADCDFEELAEHLVFSPLSMRDTFYTKKNIPLDHLAFPTNSEGVRLQPTFAQKYNAADLLYSTSNDYAKFMLSIINETREEQIASQRLTIFRDRTEELCSKLKNGQCLPNTSIGMGLGWEIYRIGSDSFLMHTGKDEGIFTFAYLSPTTRNGVLILTSSENGYRIIFPILHKLGIDHDFVNLIKSLYN